MTPSCAKECDIVKRECVPEAQRELRSTGHVRQAYGDGIGSDLVTGLFVTAQVVIEALWLPITAAHGSRERSSALRAFGGCLGAERR